MNGGAAAGSAGSIATVAIDVEVAQLHRLSLDEYHRILESGGIGEDARVELLGGLLAAMSPKTRAKRRGVPGALADAQRRPRSLRGPGLEPADARGLRAGARPRRDPAERPRPYHPATATLIVEVAVSSLQRDLGVKSELYARAGVEEYWVLDLDGRRLVVQHRPVAHGYGYRAELGETADATASVLPLPPLALAGLFAAAAA